MNPLILELAQGYRDERNGSIEDLCRDHPGLVQEVKRAVAKLDAMDQWLDPDGETKDEPAPEPASARPNIPGYEILGNLGTGGQGIVWKARKSEADPHHPGHLVALKLLKQVTPDALNRFKEECHTLQKMNHPNLVTLFVADFDAKQPYFTMELVEGRPFLPHPDTPSSLGDSSPSGFSHSWEQIDTADHETEARPAVRATPPLDRLRASLRQLADGILALHDQKILHRDIKPSNVFVRPEGQVVLLDFGLATETILDATSITQELAGTLLYMAPEQANGHAEKASDWYGFGAMLYEALTGQHPFKGTAHALPWARQTYDPPPPHTLCPNIPEDLSLLSAELLRASPTGRPSGLEVRQRLGADVPPPPPPDPPFVGREDDLAILDQAFADVRKGQTVTVLLHGKSGVGKSATVEHFLHRLCRKSSEVVVLAGRCYERESVPYKALDGLVDALSSFWKRLEKRDRAEAMRLLPMDVGPLVRIFPVLGRVETVVAAPRHGPESPDPHELRRRAFAGLREVLARIGTRWSLIVHLDDLQWGDVDSALMLTNLLLPPDPPPLLLIASFRTEDRDTSPFLRTFLPPPKAGPTMDRRELSLEKLSPEATRDLAARLLEERGMIDPDAVETVVREADGIPIFIIQLVQAILAGERDITLPRVIWSRVSALADEARRLLMVVAVAGRPLRHSVALHAAELDAQGRKHLIDLQANRLLRSGPAGQQEVETFHDRIRETVVSRLDTAARTYYHQRLALALEVWGKADPEMLAFHVHQSGDEERAWPHYVRAAEQAAEALAFDRAARLYDQALKLHRDEREVARQLRVKLAGALVNAGRGGEAGPIYLAAAEAAPAGEAADLQQKAAVQFIRSGHMAEGLAVLRTVLKGVGLTIPATHRSAYYSCLWQGAWLRLRGLRFRERPASEISVEELRRIDICAAVGLGLSLVDPARAIYFYQRNQILALRAGEPYRVARALASAISWTASCLGSRRGRNRVEQLVQRATELADRINEPYLHAWIALQKGCAALLFGEYPRCRELCAQAEDLLRMQCTGVAWELATTQDFAMWAMATEGDWKSIGQRVPALRKQAEELGDRYALTSLLVHSTYPDLAADRPDEAAQRVQQAIELCYKHGLYLKRYRALVAEVCIALYRGEGHRALQIVNACWPELQQTYQLQLRGVNLTMHYLRAKSALAAAREALDSPRRHFDAANLLRSAERDVRTLERGGENWTDMLATMIRVGLANCRGKKDEVVALLVDAERQCDASGSALYGSVARRRRGELIGGDEGRALLAAADAWMADQEIQRPDRITAVFSAGFAD